jgi:hypothetical protein
VNAKSVRLSVCLSVITIAGDGVDGSFWGLAYGLLGSMAWMSSKMGPMGDPLGGLPGSKVTGVT